MATIGEQILTVQDGYTRYDNTDSKIKYCGTGWQANTVSGYNIYQNTFSISTVKNDYISIKFTGTDIILLTLFSYGNDPNKNVIVYLDNEFSQKISLYKNTGNNQGNRVLYEFNNLENKEHTIIILNNGENTNSYIGLDAIDINTGGQLLEASEIDISTLPTIPVLVGELLIDPEDGYKRIQETDNKIKFNLWSDHAVKQYTGGTAKYTTVNGAVAKLKFYGENFRLIGAISKDCSSCFSVKVDDTLYDDLSSYTSYTQYITLTFEAKKLEKKEHTVIITNKSTGQLYFDAIDIDDYGYLIDFADIGDSLTEPIDGYSRTDINSDSLEKGIKLSKSNGVSDWQTEINNNYYNNTYCYSNNCSASVTFYFHGTDFMLIGSYNTNLNSEDISVTLDEQTQTTFSEKNDLSYKTLVYQIHDLENTDHVITFTNNTCSTFCIDAVDINSEGYLYKPTTSNFILIKQNDKYYSFNENNYNINTKKYNEVAIDADNTSEYSNDISELFVETTINGETFKPIDKFKNDSFSFVSNYNIGSKLNIYGRKTDKSLIVTKNRFSIANVDAIKYFNLEGSAIIKVAISPSDGKWYTYNNSSWIDLNLEIPEKNYSELTDEEITLWNNSKDTILSQGINYNVLNKCDFSTLTNEQKTLNFAYCIYNIDYGDKAKIQNLSWCYSKSGKLKMCKDSEYDLELSTNSAVITSLIDTDIMKISYSYEKEE